MGRFPPNTNHYLATGPAYRCKRHARDNGVMLNCEIAGRPIERARRSQAAATVSRKGTHYWMVQWTRSTSITGTCSHSSTVTVQCKSPDAQRKEGPCPGERAQPRRRNRNTNASELSA